MLLTYRIGIGQTVKDAIEALGIPHTEVDLILIDGKSVGFDHILQGEERVSVFPRFESIDITPILKVRPEPLRETKFVADVHLGRLAGYLRLFGFDCLYDQSLVDEELAHISRDDKRILLTRDRGLLKRSAVSHGCLVRSTIPREQLIEVIGRYDLVRSIQIANRCTHCNEFLQKVEKDLILDRLETDTASQHNQFMQCKGCGRIYWKGSHFEKIHQFVREIKAAVARNRNRIDASR